MCIVFSSTELFNITATADDHVFVYDDDGNILLSSFGWWATETVTYDADPCVLALQAVDYGEGCGLLASTSTGVVTDDNWKCSSSLIPVWYRASFDDSGWDNSRVIAVHGGGPWGVRSDISLEANWIWADVTPTTGTTSYCRKRLC